VPEAIIYLTNDRLVNPFELLFGNIPNALQLGNVSQAKCWKPDKYYGGDRV
jgi:hypothetical protein